MANKGKKRIKCIQPGCKAHGYLSVMELSCLDADGVPWMCPRHDERRTFNDNAKNVQ